MYDYVTCGSVLKLWNTASGVRLHSHDVKYGSGSGQQVITILIEMKYPFGCALNESSLTDSSSSDMLLLEYTKWSRTGGGVHSGKNFMGMYGRFSNGPISLKFMIEESHPFQSHSLWDAPLKGSQKGTLIPQQAQKDTLISDLLRSEPYPEKGTLF